ncbi:hypothetical protein KKA95_05105 [Patescibacteria group bacterium]|nr:hypothetical protein [Patescibacteria group bacterium]
MENHPYHERSIVIGSFRRMIEFGNRWFILSRWIFPKNKNIFYRLEVMMIVITLICVGILLYIHTFPYYLALVICLILIQRVVEFLIVYSRNFIFNQGRIFSEFPEPEIRGQWLLLMFSLNIFQIILIFAIWYRFISLISPSAFTSALTTLDSFYFSIVTFLTVGFGDITPLTTLPKVLVITQSILTFYTVVIVINGLISLHFKK